MRVLVLGGTGFIGRHAAAALRSRGHEVTIGTRHPRRPHPFPAVETHFERLTERGGWHPVLAGFDAVVNAVGILRERGAESYEKVHCDAPRALAAACAFAGRRLIHVSALGLRADARSRFLTSKLRGERAVAGSGASYSIVRPSLLDGEGGFGAKWLRAVSRWPVHFVPADARGRIAVLDVRDLGEAIAVLCERPASAEWREVELGGITALSMGDCLAALRLRHTPRPALRIAVPAWLARMASHACDLLHVSPFSYGHLELMRRDNAPNPNRLAALLGRSSNPLGVLGRRREFVDQAPVPLRRPAL